MPRDAEQILLDRLLARAAVAKIPLNTLLDEMQLAELSKIQKLMIVDKKEDKIAGLTAILEILKKKLLTPEVAAKAQENFMKEGALSQSEALKIIYPQDPKLVIPVIVKIIESLLDKVQKRKSPSSRTVAFVEAALNKVKEVDEKQNWNSIRQIALIADLTKQKIRADMQSLITAINNITFLEDEALTWFEAMLWIEGHFLREHTKALAKGNGKLEFIPEDPEVVVPIDDEDVKLCYGKGVPGWDGNKVSKHFINSHFHALAVLLERKFKGDLKLGFATVDVFLTGIVKESVIQEIAFSKPERQENRSSSSPQLFAVPTTALSTDVLPYNIIKMPDGRLQLVTFVPTDCAPERLAEAMRLFTKVMKGEQPIQLAHSPKRHVSLVDRLKRIKDEPTTEMFSLMITAFKQCALSGTEETIIHDYISSMEEYVRDNYLNAKTTGGGLWPTIPLKDRAHKPLVDAMWVKIKALDDVGNLKTVLEIICIIQTTHKESKDLKSGTLYKVLENLMVELCKHFIKCLETVEEKKSPRGILGGKQ